MLQCITESSFEKTPNIIGSLRGKVAGHWQLSRQEGIPSKRDDLVTGLYHCADHDHLLVVVVE